VDASQLSVALAKFKSCQAPVDATMPKTCLESAKYHQTAGM
jgi:hypothetical protein